ncbi:ArsR/SmtB family transcription factor [Paenibacillus ginsengarvi]|uniref:ArsR family transcriptional regulator n=1 Tax=Paenibacillus ginsengarvi TaxID=400777 RepID=A0A3B0CG00_9BACL|nr:ArsR family transcriptional regulator [Paenibacillus ginsengarvi]RKN82036.1 ArsR family transcriptional regulator [Paenibacillus ginsengarvi]
MPPPSTRPDLTFVFNPLFEYWTALSIIANQAQVRQAFQEHGEKLEQIGLIERMDEHLSRFMRDELVYFFGHAPNQTPLGDEAIATVAFASPSPLAVPDGLHAVEQLAPIPLVAQMVKSVFKQQLPALLAGRSWEETRNDRDFLLHVLDQAAAPDQQLAGRLRECLKFPDETKVRFLMLLRTFYEHVYKPLEEQIALLSGKGAEKYNDYYKQHPDHFLEAYLIGISEDALVRPTRIHISLFDQACSDMHSHVRQDEAHNWIRIGVHLDRFLGGKPQRKQAELFLKLLSDPKRIAIIEALAQRPWYAQELAKKMNLTPAAISYHMSFFYGLDAVRIRKSEQRHYYLLDKEKMRSYFALTEQVLLQD